MKIFIAILSGVSMAVLVGGYSLADEEEAAKATNTVAVEGGETDKKPRTRAKGDKDPGDEGGKDVPKGSGDPLKGLLGGHGNPPPCKPCDVPFGGTVNTGEDNEGEAGKAKYLPEQASDKAREATSKEKKKNNKGKKKDKKK